MSLPAPQSNDLTKLGPEPDTVVRDTFWSTASTQPGSMIDSDTQQSNCGSSDGAVEGGMDLVAEGEDDQLMSVEDYRRQQRQSRNCGRRRRQRETKKMYKALARQAKEGDTSAELNNNLVEAEVAAEVRAEEHCGPSEDRALSFQPSSQLRAQPQQKMPPIPKVSKEPMYVVPSFQRPPCNEPLFDNLAQHNDFPPSAEKLLLLQAAVEVERRRVQMAMAGLTLSGNGYVGAAPGLGEPYEAGFSSGNPLVRTAY